MRRIVAALCCIFWLTYGNLSGLAHTHPNLTPDLPHGLGLDHSHDAPGQEPTRHDDIDSSRLDRAATDAQRDDPFYLTVNAVRPGAKTVMVPIDLAGELFAATQARSEASPLDNNRQSGDPPSKELPGLRAPPA